MRVAMVDELDVELATPPTASAIFVPKKLEANVLQFALSDDGDVDAISGEIFIGEKRFGSGTSGSDDGVCEAFFVSLVPALTVFTIAGTSGSESKLGDALSPDTLGVMVVVVLDVSTCGLPNITTAELFELKSAS